MALIRPRLTDYYDLPIAQTECDFVIPLLDEDLPLYVDPFLLWKSPSLQDNGLHASTVGSFDSLVARFNFGARDSSVDLLVSLSECSEAGLGLSTSRQGRKIGRVVAEEVLVTLSEIPQVRNQGIRHIEIVQLLIDEIGKDRISDITCSLLKSFLIDFTIEQARKYRIPTQRVLIPEVFDHRTLTLKPETVEVPVTPDSKRAVLLIPKRWLRYSPWIGFDSYFDGAFIKQNELPTERAAVLLFNRKNYGLVEVFVSQREAAADECTNDPMFKPISRVSAKKRLASLRRLPTGKDGNADREYEDLAASLLASVLHPQLDFADEQVRTDSGTLIRDLIFYNTRTWDFPGHTQRLRISSTGV